MCHENIEEGRLNMRQNWRKYDEEGTVKMALNYEQELAR